MAGYNLTAIRQRILPETPSVVSIRSQSQAGPSLALKPSHCFQRSLRTTPLPLDHGPCVCMCLCVSRPRNVSPQTLARLQGSWCERLLKSMYYVTQRHGPAFPFEIERLWSTLAASKRNIIPILDFLTSLGVYAALQVRFLCRCWAWALQAPLCVCVCCRVVTVTIKLCFAAYSPGASRASDLLCSCKARVVTLI